MLLSEEGYASSFISMRGGHRHTQKERTTSTQKQCRERHEECLEKEGYFNGFMCQCNEETNCVCRLIHDYLSMYQSLVSEFCIRNMLTHREETEIWGKKWHKWRVLSKRTVIPLKYLQHSMSLILCCVDDFCKIISCTCTHHKKMWSPGDFFPVEEPICSTFHGKLDRWLPETQNQRLCFFWQDLLQFVSNWAFLNISSNLSTTIYTTKNPFAIHILHFNIVLSLRGSSPQHRTPDMPTYLYIFPWICAPASHR